MSHPVYSFNGWRFDTGRLTLTSPQQEVVRLSSSEIELLTVFCKKPQQTLSREEIMVGRYMTAQRSVDVAIARLRRKLQELKASPALIVHVRNQGYYFTAPVDEVSGTMALNG